MCGQVAGCARQDTTPSLTAADTTDTQMGRWVESRVDLGGEQLISYPTQLADGTIVLYTGKVGEDSIEDYTRRTSTDGTNWTSEPAAFDVGDAMVTWILVAPDGEQALITYDGENAGLVLQAPDGTKTVVEDDTVKQGINPNTAVFQGDKLDFVSNGDTVDFVQVSLTDGSVTTAALPQDLAYSLNSLTTVGNQLVYLSFDNNTGDIILNALDPATGASTELLNPVPNATSSQALTGDADGAAYYACTDGIYRLAPGGTLPEQVVPAEGTAMSISSNTACDVNYYAWGGARISHILRNPFYKGAHLVCRTHQKGIRSNTYDIIPREDWEIIEGCHEAIVTPEEWEQVQAIVDRRSPIMKGNACPFYNLFHGIIYCATCGKSMQVRYEKVGRTGKNRFTGEMREPIDKAYYICQTYNRLGKNACTSHKIEARDLYNLVLKDIQELAAMALKDADAFYQRLSSRMERRYMADASEMQKERERLEARNREIDDMFLSLYTDKAKGVISEQRFMKLTAAMEQEQEENQRCLQELMRMLQQSDAQENEVRTFIRELRQYATIQELDETVLNRLISRILVGEVKKVNGQKTQEVRIVYNFVGEIAK